LDAALARARQLADAVGGATGEFAALFRAAYSAAAAVGPRPPRSDIVPRLVDSVLRPLSGLIARIPNGTQPAAGDEPRPGAGENRAAAPVGDQPRPRVGEDRTAPLAGDLVWRTAQSATRLRASLGRAGQCPPELAEATAALQALACDLVPAPEAGQRLAR